jgi:hypothetical protein
MNNRIYQKPYGDKGWAAKAYEDFMLKDGRTARLEVSTWKVGGLVITLAHIGFVTEPGVVVSEIFSDYVRRLANVKQRCTKQAVEDQQACFLDMWEAIKGDAIAHYEGVV